jgi:BolA protein
MEMSRMSVKERMAAKLQAAFLPTSLEVIDESRLHAGHAGSGGGTDTHFRVKIVTKSFEGRSRLDRHRAVNAILADELTGGVHALAIEARAPNE